MEAAVDEYDEPPKVCGGIGTVRYFATDALYPYPAGLVAVLHVLSMEKCVGASPFARTLPCVYKRNAEEDFDLMTDSEGHFNTQERVITMSWFE